MINVAEVIAMIDLNIYEAMVVRVREAIGKTVIRIGKHCLKLVGEAGNAVICIASRRIDLPESLTLHFKIFLAAVIHKVHQIVGVPGIVIIIYKITDLGRLRHCFWKYGIQTFLLPV